MKAPADQLLVIVFAACTLWPYSAESLAASSPAKIVIAHAAMNARVAPLWVAQEHGFFAKNGVAANTIFIRQAPVLVAALSVGDVQIGYTGGTSVMAAVAGGADLKMIASLINRLGYDLVAAPSIKSAKDLRGKRFGVQSLGGTIWMAGILGLEHVGLDPARDNINFLAIGDQTVLTQALEAGRIDATVLDGVFSRRLKQKGFTIIAELQQTDIPFSGQGLIVKSAYLQEQRETLEGLLKGLLEGIAFSVAPKNKSAVVGTIMKRLKLSDPAVAEEGYQDVMKSVDRRPYPSIDGLRNIQRLMKTQTPAAQKVKVEEMVDDRILRRLDQSGFIDKLFEAYGVKN
ncbi:MAG TPA: ABC transporter substrate-binding protein [Candidatus Binatia bacterium]|jgi:NitT/TauT family transport system substrate-binding protein